MPPTLLLAHADFQTIRHPLNTTLTKRNNVCFKKTWTNCSSVSLLQFVQVFFFETDVIAFFFPYKPIALFQNFQHVLLFSPIQLRKHLKDLEYRLHHRLSKFDRSVFLTLKPISYFLVLIWLGFLFRTHWS